ncbi:hypothetical protein F4808DRAFT_424301 [Astrocystis sublimbata]|nr:hypothetical protein F4808DRAFT_424301 [Astrocystis sublimbata]
MSKLGVTIVTEIAHLMLPKTSFDINISTFPSQSFAEGFNIIFRVEDHDDNAQAIDRAFVIILTCFTCEYSFHSLGIVWFMYLSMTQIMTSNAVHARLTSPTPRPILFFSFFLARLACSIIMQVTDGVGRVGTCVARML